MTVSLLDMRRQRWTKRSDQCGSDESSHVHSRWLSTCPAGRPTSHAVAQLALAPLTITLPFTPANPNLMLASRLTPPLTTHPLTNDQLTPFLHLDPHEPLPRHQLLRAG